MQSITTAFGDLLTGILLMLVGPTVCMLLIRRFVPYLGDQLWRMYCNALLWLLRAPFRLIRLLIDEITAARRRP